MSFFKKGLAEEYLRVPIYDSVIQSKKSKGKNVNVLIKDSMLSSAYTIDIPYANIHLVNDDLDTDLIAKDTTKKILSTLEESGIYHLLYHGGMLGHFTFTSASSNSTDFCTLSGVDTSGSVSDSSIIKGAFHDSDPTEPLVVAGNSILELMSSPGENNGMINKEEIVCKASGSILKIHHGFQITSKITLSDGSTAGDLILYDGCIISSEIAVGATAANIYLRCTSGNKFNFKPTGTMKGGHPKADAVTHGTLKLTGTGNITIYHDEEIDSTSLQNFYDMLVTSSADGYSGNLYFQLGSKLDLLDKTYASADQLNAQT